MTIDPVTPIPPERLKRIRWKGERAYRILSHSFSVRWNLALKLDRLDQMWGGFVVPSQDATKRNSASSNGALVYSLVDLGPRDRRRYRMFVGDKELTNTRRPDDLVNHLLWQILSHTDAHTEEFLLIHSGSVATPRGEGVLLPAESGSGKTTLVTALIRNGFGFLSDEIGVIDHRAGLLRPYPRALNFKEGSEALFPYLLPPDHPSPLARSDGYLRAEEIRDDVLADPCEVRFVIAPRYQEGEATRVTALSPGATVKELWTHTMNHGAHGVEALTILAEVARGARGYRLVSGDLKEAVQAVEELTGSS